MSSESAAYIGLVGPALGVIIVALAGAVQGKKKPAQQTENAEVVAATFVERGLMEQLTLALREVVSAVRQSSSETAKLVELLEADAQRRHDEAIIREALRRRGVTE